MDYTTLIAPKATAGSIASWINSDSVTPVAPTLIQEAESFIYRRLRHWKMLTKATGNMVIGNDFVAQPSDYLEARTLMITGINKRLLDRKTIDEVTAAYQYDGTGVRVNQQPGIYSNDGTTLAFDSPSDQTYPYMLRYYQQPLALGPSNLTNFITSLYPRLMRVALMAGASEFMKDAGQGTYDRTYWEQLIMAEIMASQAESDHEQRAVTGSYQLS